MTVSANDLADIRRMVNEPDDSNGYDDTLLTRLIETHAVMDNEGRDPDHDDWVATYDLNAAASDIWTEKAAKVAHEFDFTSDGATFRREQKVKHAKSMAAFYASRRRFRTITQIRGYVEKSEQTL